MSSDYIIVFIIFCINARNPANLSQDIDIIGIYYLWMGLNRLKEYKDSDYARRMVVPRSSLTHFMTDPMEGLD